jgi:prepilin-type N-terminal cleavage/methylation domain-containing protein
MRTRQKGFSLIELMIVVAIILIIAAIAIPNLLSARMAGNEASAVGSVRTLNTACITYNSTWGVGYPALLSNLGPGSPATATNADLIDVVLSSGTKSGYSFVYVAGAPDGAGNIDSYTLNANPTVPGSSGIRFFYTDQGGVITYAYGTPAAISDNPL